MHRRGGRNSLTHKHDDAMPSTRVLVSFCIDDECMFSASVQHNKKIGRGGGHFVLFVSTLSRRDATRRHPWAKRWEGAGDAMKRGEIKFNGRQRYSSPVRLLSSTIESGGGGGVCRKGRHVMQRVSLSLSPINALIKCHLAFTAEFITLCLTRIVFFYFIF